MRDEPRERDERPRGEVQLLTKEYFETTLASKLAELKFEMVKWIVGSVGAATVTLLVAMFRIGRP